MQNRFAGLDSSDQSGSAPQGYDGRGSGGRWLRRSENARWKYFQPSSFLRFGRGGAYTGRNSRGGSSEQERSADRRGAGRAEAAQSVCKSSLMLIFCHQILTLLWIWSHFVFTCRCGISWASQRGRNLSWVPTPLFRFDLNFEETDFCVLPRD